MAEPVRRALHAIVDDLLRASDDVDSDGVYADSVLERIEALGGELVTKAEVYAAVVRRLSAEAEACAAMADHYRDAARAKTETAARLKGGLQAALEATGQRRVDTPTAAVWLQASPPRVDLLVDVDELPDDLVVVERRPAMAAIKSRLADGPDSRVGRYARLTHSQHVRIR